MKRDELQELMTHDFNEILDINNTKGEEYARDVDALANFKRHADALGLTPEQIWAVYASKHWDAIISFVKNGEVLSEPIEGRIHDAILYLFLLRGLIVDRHRQRELDTATVEIT